MLISLVLAFQLTAAPAAVERAQPQSFTVKVEGSGRPMILIPGLLSSGDVWADVVAHYRNSYQCHVVTLAGFAGVPAQPKPSLARVRDDIIQYIRSKNLDRPVLVGHSLGGFMALWVAATASDLAGPVISVDGVPFISALQNPAATPQSARPQADQIASLYASMRPERFVAQSRLAFATMMRDPARVETAATWAAASDAAATGAMVAEMMTTDIRADVVRIASPVLLIGAPREGTTPEQRKLAQQAYEAQVAGVKDRHVVFAENARHFVMYDDLPFLLKTMDGFLQRNGGGVR